MPNFRALKNSRKQNDVTCLLYLVVLFSTDNYVVGIRRHYHESSDYFEYKNVSGNDFCYLFYKLRTFTLKHVS